MTTTSTDEMSKEERDRLMSKGYTAAQSALRVAHQDEFNKLYQEELAKLGIAWEPRKSKEDAALDQIQELLAQFPDLAEKLAKRIATAA